MTAEAVTLLIAIALAIVLVGILAALDSHAARIRGLAERLEHVERRHLLEDDEALRRQMFPKRDSAGRIIERQT